MAEGHVVFSLRQYFSKVCDELPGPIAVLVEGDVQLEGGDDGGQVLLRVEDGVLGTSHQHKQVDLKQQETQYK